MNKKLKQAIITAQDNGLTDEKLDEFLAQFKPKGRDLSNPYSMAPTSYLKDHQYLHLHFETISRGVFERYVLQAKHILRKALDKERGDWRPDWTDSGQHRWMPIMHHMENFLDIVEFTYKRTQIFPDWVYIPSKEAWKRVIEEVGEDCVKLALFEIEG